MTQNIKYCNLKHFINTYSLYTEIIKDKYIALLSDLSKTSQITNFDFINIVDRIFNNGIIIIAYIGFPDDDYFAIVGSGTVFIETKILRGGCCVGHIEDVVTHKEYRNMKISTNIINKLRYYCVSNKCYKIILNCYDDLNEFYVKQGFTRRGLEMVYYI